MIGGSPCQGFSFAGKQLNFDDPRSKLFFEFVRLLEETKPKYFLLENVKMKKEHEKVITKYLGVEPILINSALLTAHNRPRLYWTNIPNVEQPSDKGICFEQIRDLQIENYEYISDEKTINREYKKNYLQYDITAIEYNEHIAKVYKEQYPKDNVLVADAHEYLLKHYTEFDFIWSSPPCPTHSRMCFAKKEKQYIDFKLYQEIVLLKSWFKGKWVVENVVPYYGYLIEPTVILGRHPFWANFDIEENEFTNIDISRSKKEDLLKERMIDWSIFNCIKDVPENRSKDNRFERLQLVRNMVNPKIGEYIFKKAWEEKKEEKEFKQQTLFNVQT